MNQTIKDAPVTTMAMVASLATEGGAMTVAQLKANRELMKEVMQELMEPGKHYGKIPGSSKPSLFKAGAELLCVLFRVNAKPTVEDLSDEDCVRYRIHMEGVHIPTGQVVAYGVGECSTNEEKYKWRAARSRHEFADVPEDRRRWKYGNSDDPNDGVNQVRTNPADAANTILKMAEKRAKCDLALSFSAASDVFAQDLEDLAEWLREKEGDEKPPAASGGRYSGKSSSTSKPAAKNDAPPSKLNEQQLAHLRREIDKVGCGERPVCLKYNVDVLEDLPFAQLNPALKYVADLQKRPE